MTRVSDRARYCHHCATPIVPQGSAGEQTTRPCPACGRRHKLYGRSLGDPAVSLLECLHCAGIWLTLEAFEIVAQQSREKTLPEGVLQRGPEAPEQTDGPAGPGDKFYRHCPQCRKLMNRRNFGKRSGVVIDSCKDHGIWFDARELGAILSWMRKGGEGRAARQSREEARQAERKKSIKYDLRGRMDTREEVLETRGLGALLGSLFDL